MRSSTGQYFLALDHIRALAFFMVFTWHFMHGANGANGFPIPFNSVPAIFPLALLDEGHVGVALFMTLSGYLFAKLIDGRAINYTAFLWNRIIRLLPLLTLQIIIVGICQLLKGQDLPSYVFQIGKGILFPVLPNGGWSITIEFHYYVILPLFLWMLKRSKFLPISLIVAAIAFRLFLFLWQGEVQSFAYWTIIGRIDQFALGMLIFQFRSFFAHRHFLAVTILSSFALFYWWFDLQGGFYNSPSYPSPSVLWVFLSTLEGLAFAIGIAWYDSSFSPLNTGISGFIARIGTYSYSLYLFHCFVVFDMAKFIHGHVMNISNFYVASGWSVVCFLLIVPAGYLSFRFIEKPFLKLRKLYVKNTI